MRLERRLLLFILLPLIVILLIASLILRSYYADFLKKQAEAMLLSEAGKLKKMIEERIRKTGSDLGLLLSNRVIMNYFIYSELGLLDHAEDERWVVERDLLSASMEKPEYFRIRLIGIDGKSVVDIIDRKISYRHYDFSGVEWFRKTLSLKKGEINISESYLCDEFREPTITVSRLYFDEMNRKMGIGSVDIHLADLFEQIVSMHMGGGYAYLMDKDGIIMAHTDRSRIGSVLKGMGGTIDETDGMIMKKVYMPLDIKGLSLVLARPMEELLSFGRGLRLFTIVFSIAMILFVSLTTILTTKRFRKPLKQIAMTMDEVRQGKFDINMDIDPKGTKDEIGDLARAFTSMALSLKEREMSLRESEEKYRTLFEVANDAIYLIDPENHKIVDFNKKAVEMSGYSVDELRKKDFKDIHGPEELSLILHKFSEVAGGNVSTSIPEHYHIRKDGSHISVEANIALVEIREKRLIMSIVRDVTERKKRDEEIRRRAKELEEFYEIAINRELVMGELKEKLEKKEQELQRLRERYKDQGSQ